MVRLYIYSHHIYIKCLSTSKMVKGKKQATPAMNRRFFPPTSLFLCQGFLCSNPFIVVTQHCDYYVTIPAVISEQLMHRILQTAL